MPETSACSPYLPCAQPSKKLCRRLKVGHAERPAAKTGHQLSRHTLADQTSALKHSGGRLEVGGRGVRQHQKSVKMHLDRWLGPRPRMTQPIEQPAEATGR
jgi:hypothetical protein